MSSGSNAAPAAASVSNDNRLAFLDQASFLRLRAIGIETIAQVTWYYYREVDVDGLQRRLNRNLAHTLLGRRIERSPLPFGRHRWVACHDVPEIHVADTPRPRSEVGSWMDDRAQVPVDPEHGPCWHLSVLPLDDGGAAVTLVASHTVADALGLCIAVFEALNDQKRDMGYPPPRSRGLAKAVIADLWDAIRGIPAAIVAFFAALAIMFKRTDTPAGKAKMPPPPPPPAGVDLDKPYVLPAVTVWVDLPAWDARADALAVSSNVFFIAFGTKLAERMGRVNPLDGTVSIAMPVSERTWEDTRGNALTSASFTVDPAEATADLQIIRREVKQGLATVKDTPNELLKPLPLVPYIPRWLARKMEEIALGGPERAVGCSNLRDMSQAFANIDGVSDGDYGSARMFNRGITRRALERQGGELYLVSGRINGQIFISVSAYHCGAANTQQYLRELVEQTVADFDLTAAGYEVAGAH